MKPRRLATVALCRSVVLASCVVAWPLTLSSSELESPSAAPVADSPSSTTTDGCWGSCASRAIVAAIATTKTCGPAHTSGSQEPVKKSRLLDGIPQRVSDRMRSAIA